jgi:O-antigen ligase
MARRFHFWALMLVVGVAPLPLGSNRPLAWSLLALAVGLLCLSLPAMVWLDRRGRLLSPRAIALPLATFAAAIVWIVATSLSGWGFAIFPPIWSTAAPALMLAGAERHAALSIDPEATRSGLLRLLTYGGVFWLALQHSHLSRRPFRMVDALAVVAMIYAAYGLAEYVSGAETILGRPKFAYLGDLTSTFINRNSYADFAGLGMLCCVASVARRLDDRRPGLIPLLLHLRRRTAVFALGAAGVAVALLCTGSRAGAVAAVLGLASLLLFLWLRTADIGPRGRGVILAGWFLLIAATAAWLLLLSDAFAVNGVDRVTVYRRTIAAIRDRPWLGTGLGTFPAMFETLRPPSLALPWRQAHDTYLELMLELGIPGAICLLAPIAWSVARLAASLTRLRVHGDMPALGLAATILIAAHTLVDFSAQIPAVAVYWLAILAAAVAQAGSNNRTGAVQKWSAPAPGSRPRPALIA